MKHFREPDTEITRDEIDSNIHHEERVRAARLKLIPTVPDSSDDELVTDVSGETLIDEEETERQEHTSR